MQSKKEKFEELSKHREQALLGGGVERMQKIHESGRLTARERIHMLFDEGTFQELGVFVTHRSTWPGMEDQRIVGEGVVCGHGLVNSRNVFAFAQDFTVFGGIAQRGERRQDHPPPRHGDGERRPRRRALRQRRGAHPGRCGEPRRIRRHLPPQHALVRSHSPDLGDHGAVRRRGRLLPRHHRLHIHGEGHEPHVHHRTRT